MPPYRFGWWPAIAITVATLVVLVIAVHRRNVATWTAATVKSDQLLARRPKLPPETSREWGRKIAMDKDVIETVTKKWARLGLPGDGKPVWK